MTTMAKKELIDEVKPRYLKADKKEKGRILDEFCRNAGYARKYATRILQAGYDYHRVKNEGRKNRNRKYDSKIMSKVIRLWEFLEYPCGARLEPCLLATAEAFERCGAMQIDGTERQQLSEISAKTLDRRLEKEREIRKLDRTRGATRHGSLLKSSIPIRITSWDANKIGFMEMDTVAHNGGDPSGEFIYSLDLVEIATGWSEQSAVKGRGETGIIRSIDEIKADLPFKLLGLDSDGGSEFINWNTVRYCEKNKLFFTRSRPDRKNDNAYVEQKNYTHIRKWLGYGRYDTMEQLAAINDLYRNEMRLFNNFFRPVMKMVSKEKINNSVCRKKYDSARTPYQRLLDSKAITAERKNELTKTYLSLNPIELKHEIDQKIEKIKRMAKLQNKCLSR